MRFDIITIFPEIFHGFLRESLIKKAQEKGLIKIAIHNLRNWATDKHKTVDDRPFGGGRGMVLKIEPIYRAVQSLGPKTKNPRRRPFGSLRGRQKPKIILFTPRGKKFNQKMAYSLSQLNQLILICGRYEGVDERVAKYIADIELSIGDYVLMGGEVPAMVVIETVSRLIPGVLQKSELLPERMTKKRGRAGRGFIEYPQYTRPAIFNPSQYIKNQRFFPPKFRSPALTLSKRSRAGKAKPWRVPKILLSGNHKKIEEWRKKHSKIIEK